MQVTVAIHTWYGGAACRSVSTEKAQAERSWIHHTEGSRSGGLEGRCACWVGYIIWRASAGMEVWRSRMQEWKYGGAASWSWAHGRLVPACMDNQNNNSKHPTQSANQAGLLCTFVQACSCVPSACCCWCFSRGTPQRFPAPNPAPSVPQYSLPAPAVPAPPCSCA